jgi:formylglycine-generating enzyme
MARVGRVCVDKYESVLVQMLPRGKEQAWSVHRPPDASKLPLRAVAKAGVKPQAFVSGVEAQKACFAAGKRLCGAGEWRRACRGPRSLNYPYGEKRKRGVCNDSGRKTHPVAAVASRYGIPRERMWSEGMQHPKINRLPNTVRATAASKGCTNAFGVYDMVGNLHEWVDDPAGTFQGGYYMDTKINGDGCNYRTTAHGFSYRDYSTGFRCCMDADNVE